MSKSRKQKEAEYAAVKDSLSRAQVAILADYRGLTVEEITELRRKLDASKVEFRVVKNTITGLVAKELGVEGLHSFLEGPTAIAFGYDDPVAPAKGLSDFIKDKKKMEIKAAVLEGRVIGLEEVKRLSELPTKEVLLAKVLGSLQAPLVGLASVLQAPMRGCAIALNAVREKREAAG